MVGRERELAALRAGISSEQWASASCHLFTLLGAAGVGKSRLVTELLAGVGDGATIMRGRCLPLRRGHHLLAAGRSSPRTLRRRSAGRHRRRPRGGRSAPDHRASRGRGRPRGNSRSDATRPSWAVRSPVRGGGAGRGHWWSCSTTCSGPSRRSSTSSSMWRSGRATRRSCSSASARPEFLDERPSWSGGKFNATSVLLERAERRRIGRARGESPRTRSARRGRPQRGS